MRRRLPPHKHVPYEGTKKTIKEMVKAATGRRGAQSLRVRTLAEDVVRFIEPRDKLSQLAALYYWYEANHNYLGDPTAAEMVKDPEAAVDEVEEKGAFVGDCDDAATVLSGLAESIGIKTRPMRVGFRKPVILTLGSYRGRPRRVKIDPPYTHVLAVARDQYGRIVVLDPVAGKRTHRMLRRTRRYG